MIHSGRSCQLSTGNLNLERNPHPVQNFGVMFIIMRIVYANLYSGSILTELYNGQQFYNFDVHTVPTIEFYCTL